MYYNLSSEHQNYGDFMYIQNIMTLNKFKIIILIVIFNTLVGNLSHAQFATPSPLPLPAQMNTDNYNDSFQVGYCLNQAGSNSCTANDFTITSITTLNVDDGCTSATDYMQIDLEVTFAKQTPTRYDVGAWFYRGTDATSGTDFNTQDAITGDFCTRIAVGAGLLTPDGDLTANDPADNGVCIDVPSGTPGNLTPQVLEDLILPCREVSAPADGIVDISACTTWQNSSGSNCAGPEYQEFDLAWPNSPFATEIQPQTGSKCNCAEFDGGPNLVNIPDINVTKTCTPTELAPGETTTCTITMTNTGMGPLVGATAINEAGFFYEDDYPENQGSIGTITTTPGGISVADGFTKDTAADNTTNQSLNIYPGTIAASGGSVEIVYEFITSASLPSSITTITNTVCANYYNDNATVGVLPDDAVFQYTSTEPGQCATAQVTTPVGIASFHAKESDVGGYDVFWTTSTETGNLGFNLYAIAGQTRYQLNKKMIVSKVIDSMTNEKYNYHVDTQLFGFIDKFIIEDVDRFGRRHTNGVYELNKQYGYVNSDEQDNKTDWQKINFVHQQRQKDIQNERAQTFNAKAVNSHQSTNDNLDNVTVDIKINESGIYQVSFGDLYALGINLNDLNSSNINVTHKGNLVPLDMMNLSKNGKFQKYSYFQFYADSINTLYTDNNIYELNLFSAIASPKMRKVSANPRGNNFVQSYQKTTKINRNLNYSFGSPIESEPWFDTNMFAYQSPLNTSFDIYADDLENSGSKAALTFEYWGGLDYSNDDMDHKINFAINGTRLGFDEFDGITARSIQFPIQISQLQNINEINIELPASTINGLDLISLESISLTYPSKFIASENYLAFEMDQHNFSVTGFSEKSIQIFALQNSEIVKLKKFKIKRSNNGLKAEFSGLSGSNKYFVMTAQSVLVPELKLSLSKAVELVPTEHLIISHVDFIGSELQTYASATRHNYRIVDVENIYNRYSHKIASGEAIKQFIQEMANNSDLKSVLLVGGDSYDYKNYLGLNAISFVPTIYRETDDLIKYSAVDALYGDANDDGIPEVAIGRLPVRTLEELKTIIEKSFQYMDQSNNLSAVLAADNSETYDSYNFSASSNALADQFINANWTVEKSYLDDISIEAARNVLIDEMNSGVRLAMYTGHSSSKRWAFEGMFRNSDVNNLINENNPFGIVQWGCWNTYFVHPEEDSLGHAFMLSGNKGAAFVVGASTLTNAGEESRFSSLFNIYMLAEDLTIGEALTHAKYEYNQESNQLHKDILWGISLLGDPVIKINNE